MILRYSIIVLCSGWPFVERQLMSRILPYLTQQQEFPINDRLEVGQSISQLVNKSVSH